MKHLKHIQEALSDFLGDEGVSVIAINGSWGVGKTYFWNNYIDYIKTSMKCDQVAYVTLP